MSEAWQDAQYKAKYQQYADATDEALRRRFEDGALHREVAEAMRYSLFAGGKRLRPVLLLSSCELCGGDVNAALPFACALEMIHTYSLIHDDLPAMDDDELRRGKPTSHVRFGEAMAVLAGDALLNFAFETMLHCVQAGCASHLSAMRLIAHSAGASGMIAGQAADLANEKNLQTNETVLHYIHEHKTGALIRAAAMAGGMLAEADQEKSEALRKYSHNLGLAFQATDDILDTIGNSSKMGKTLGKDARAQKLTFIRVYGLKGAREKTRQYVECACEALAPFGKRAIFLQYLASSLLERDH